MQAQLRPGTEVWAKLRENLAKKKTAPVGRYAVIAACGAVIVGVVLVFGPAAKF